MMNAKTVKMDKYEFYRQRVREAENLLYKEIILFAENDHKIKAPKKLRDRLLKLLSAIEERVCDEK